MKHGSLFSGIGGFDLAAEWAGWDNVFHCEINPFGRQVLKYYWPDSEMIDDVKDIEKFKKYEGTVDIISGGFPCQPFSLAGKHKGTEDDRHLWPAMLEVIRTVKPTWVVGENVYGIVSWDGGLVFEQVQSDLEGIGYEVQSYVIPACAVNAPHRRDRTWFVAHYKVNGRRERQGPHIDESRWENEKYKPYNRNAIRGRINTDGISWIVANSASNRRNWDRQGIEIENMEQEPGQPGKLAGRFEGLCFQGNTTNAISERLQGPKLNETSDQDKSREQTHRSTSQFHQITDWRNFPTQPPVRSRNDELSTIVVRNIKSEVYGQISERYTDKDLQEVWKAFQSEEVREQIGRLYKIHEPGLLLKIVQLCSPSNNEQKGTSVWSEKTSEKLLSKLREYGKFADTPQGRELEKQFRGQFADTLPYLSHEISLVTMEVERVAKSFASWHRNESIKAYGNAVVPELVYQIFKAINEYEKTTKQTR